MATLLWIAADSGSRLRWAHGLRHWPLYLVPGLKVAKVAIVQLSVPVIACLDGIVFIGEPLTPRLVLSSTAIFGGIAPVIPEKQLANDSR